MSHFICIYTACKGSPFIKSAGLKGSKMMFSSDMILTESDNIGLKGDMT